MGLLNNGIRHVSKGRMFGSTNIDGANASILRSRFGRTAELRSMILGDGISNPQASIPSASKPPYSWMIPKEGGGIKSFRRCEIGVESSVVAELGMVRNASATIGIESTAAVGGVVSSTLTATFGVEAVAAVDGVLAGTATATIGVDGSAAWMADGTMTAQAAISIDGSAAWVGDGIMTAYSTFSEAAETLTAESVAQEVMDSVIEGGFTLQDVLKILAAVAAGKTTITPAGGGDATVTIRNLTDTTDILVADMADSERQSVTITV